MNQIVAAVNVDDLILGVGGVGDRCSLRSSGGQASRFGSQKASAIRAALLRRVWIRNSRTASVENPRVAEAGVAEGARGEAGAGAVAEGDCASGRMDYLDRRIRKSLLMAMR